MVQDLLEKSIVLDVDVSRAWDLITHPVHLNRWYADDGAEVDLRPGGALWFRWKDAGKFLGVVERVEPNRLFAYETGVEPERQPFPAARVHDTFTLTPLASGTRLDLTIRGFASLPGDDGERSVRREGFSGAWTNWLEVLQRYAHIR